MTVADKPLRIGIWAAVSSKEQAADDKNSIPDQLQAGEAFAAAIGGAVAARYVVPGHTRDLIFWSDAEEGMVAYRQFREDCQARRLDLVWILDPDRAGRDPALGEQLYSLARKNGIEVYCSTSPHPVGQQTTSHRYMYSFQSVRASEDQALRVYRFHSGMKSRVLKRGLPAAWPMGYRPVRNEQGRVIGAQESDLAGAVREATRLFLQGLSYEVIGRRLDASPWRPPRAERWKSSTLREMLLNDCYAGLPVWKGARPDEPSPCFPPLWDGETFQAVIRERRRRAQGPYRRTGGGPFSGVAFCGRCGWRMYRWRHHRYQQHYYLNCGMYGAVDRTRCVSNHVMEGKVVDAVADALEVFTDPAALDAALAAIGGGEQEATLRADMANARESLADLERRRVRLGHAYAAGDMEAGIYRQVDVEIAQQIDAEKQRMADLERAIVSLPDIGRRRGVLELLSRDFRRLVAQREPAEVATLLHEAGLKVICLGGEVAEVKIV